MSHKIKYRPTISKQKYGVQQWHSTPVAREGKYAKLKDSWFSEPEFNGLPESVVAAALSRIGNKVLHLDRNDYYSGYWASFSFDGLQEWIVKNNNKETSCSEILQDQPQEGEVSLPCQGHGISNIEVRSYLREEDVVCKVEETNENGSSSPTSNDCVGKAADEVESLTSDESKDETNLVTDDFVNDYVDSLSKVKEGDCIDDFSHHEPENGTDLDTGTNKDVDSLCNINKSNEVDESSTSPKLSDSADRGTDDLSPHGPEGGTNSDMDRGSSRDSRDSSNEGCAPVNDEMNELEYKSSSLSSNTDIINGTKVSENKLSERAKTAEETVDAQNIPNLSKKRKMKNEKKMGQNSILKDFSEKSRKFNLDLSPKVLFSRGLLVESLISANISHYAEFKIVSRILTRMDEKIEEVPCSRSDVFGSELINVLEKRALMRFMTFCVSLEDCPEQYEAFKDKPFVDFLKSRKLTPSLQHIILNNIAAVPQNTSTVSGLKATQKFLQSLGRYGNTPFLWSLYGAGEVPQAFCRMCAVFGGIYCLRKNVKSLVLDRDKKTCLAVISEDGQRLNTKWLIMEKSYAPTAFKVKSESMTSRAIFITDRSLKPAVREHISILTLPNHACGSPVRVLELAPSSMACPEALYVVHFTTETVVSAFKDLHSYAEELFTIPGADDDSGKPVVLWSVYFNMENGVPSGTDALPCNVKLTSLPSPHLDFEDAMKEAKEIFTSICPDEEFLSAVPNPEDIIWDDIGDTSGTKEDVCGQAGDVTEQRSATEGSNVEKVTTSNQLDLNAGETVEKLPNIEKQ